MTSLTGDDCATASHNYCGLGLLVNHLRLLVGRLLHHRLTGLLNLICGLTGLLHHWLTGITWLLHHLLTGLLHHHWLTRLTGLFHVHWLAGLHHHRLLRHSGVGWLWLTGYDWLVLHKRLLLVTIHLNNYLCE